MCHVRNNANHEYGNAFDRQRTDSVHIVPCVQDYDTHDLLYVHILIKLTNDIICIQTKY